MQSQCTKISSLLYTNSKLPEKEIKVILFLIPTKKLKYLGIDLTREMRDLYNDNYRSLMNTTKEDTKKWKDILCSRTGNNHHQSHTNQSNLQIQCNPYQNSNGIFRRSKRTTKDPEQP